MTMIGLNGAIMRMKPYERNQLPFVGKSYKAVDQYADAQKMYADYMRNVGRDIKYKSMRDPRYTTTNIADTAISSINGIAGAGKTVRKLV